MLLKLSCNVLSAFIILLLFSCSNDSKEEIENYKQIDSSFQITIRELEVSVLETLRSLDIKTTDPPTEEKAKLWLTKAEAIRKHIKAATSAITDIKSSTNKNASKEELLREEETNNLQAKLKLCEDSILLSDRSIKDIFEKNLPFAKNIGNLAFRKLSKAAAIARLSQIEADLKATEYMLVKYCLRRVPNNSFIHDYHFPMTFGHNSVYYPGEKAEINAGIGSFSSHSIPEITVNGKKAERTPMGHYQHQFRVSNQPGNYKAVVLINYVDANTGQPSTVKKIIRYKVIVRCPE